MRNATFFDAAARGNLAVALPLIGSALAWAWLLVLAEAEALQLCGSNAEKLAVRDAFFEWALMCAAMMLPLTVPQLAQLRASCFRSGEAAAVIGTLIGYLSVWLTLLPLAVLAGAALREFDILIALLAVSLALFPMRAQLLRRCHVVPRLLGNSYFAQASLYGLRLGIICAATCAPAMLALIASGAGLPWMVLLAMALLTERFAHDPAPREGAVLLAMVLVPAALLA